MFYGFMSRPPDSNSAQFSKASIRVSGRLFTLAIHTYVKAISRIPGMKWSGFYFDDGTVHGTLHAVCTILVNPAKSKLWVLLVLLVLLSAESR